MTDALNKLIEAVEAGTWSPSGHPIEVMPNYTEFSGAYHGDLNAAKALHEALLPGWRVENLCQHVFKGHWWCSLLRPTEGDEAGNITRHGRSVYIFDQVSPARAWLLAILRAYATQQEATP